jgi:hypothetical protein
MKIERAEERPVEPGSTTIDPEQRPSQWLPMRFEPRDQVAILTLLVMPVVVLALLRVSPYFRLNNGDPFIYIGYANDFVGHVERFGYTYHSVRFGLIFPLRLSLAFGPVWGYFILRYVLYLVAIVPMYIVLRRYGRRLALFGPVLFVANPVSAEAILTTHPDTIVVPCFAALLCLLVLAIRTRGWRAATIGLVAGLVAGIGMNANIFFAPLLGVAMLVVCIVLLTDRRIVDMLRIGASYVVGVGGVCVAGMLAYKHLFGDADIYQTTINQGRNLQNTSTFRSPSYVWLETRRYTYAPLIAGLLGATVLWQRRRERYPDRSERFVIVGVFVAALAVFFVHEFVFDGNSIETSYYYSYLIGPTCVVVASALAWRKSIRPVPAVVLLAFPIVAAYVSQTFSIGGIALFAAIAGALCVAVIWSKTALAVAAAVLAMNLAWGASPRTIPAIPGAAFQFEPHYEDAFGSYDTTGYDAYRIASELPDAVPSIPNGAVPLNFWYHTGDALLDSVEATYHWETLTVQHRPAPGMPDINAQDLTKLKSLVGGYVVLLARTNPEIDAGLDSLVTAGFTLGPQPKRVTLRHGNSAVIVQPIKLVAGPG